MFSKDILFLNLAQFHFFKFRKPPTPQMVSPNEKHFPSLRWFATKEIGTRMIKDELDSLKMNLFHVKREWRTRKQKTLLAIASGPCACFWCEGRHHFQDVFKKVELKKRTSTQLNRLLVSTYWNSLDLIAILSELWFQSPFRPKTALFFV